MLIQRTNRLCVISAVLSRYITASLLPTDGSDRSAVSDPSEAVRIHQWKGDEEGLTWLGSCE